MSPSFVKNLKPRRSSSGRTTASRRYSTSRTLAMLERLIWKWRPLRTTGSAVSISSCCRGACTLRLRWRLMGLGSRSGAARSSRGNASSDVYTSIFTIEWSFP